MGGIAKRRHELKKKKHKARKLYPNDPSGKMANHLTSCSCHMCGNQRKYYGDSWRDIRDKQDQE